MKAKIIIAGLIAAALMGCEQKKPEPILYQHFVTHYYNVDNFVLSQNRDLTGMDGGYGLSRSIIIEAGEATETWSFMDEGEKREKYEALCAKNGDMTYNSPKVYLKEFLAFDIASIDITSDVDFDATHPAGTSLNDAMQFFTISVYPYIKSGYTDLAWWTGKKDNDLGAYHKIYKPLKDATIDDWKLCSQPFGHFFIEVVPIDIHSLINKTHNITITLTTDDGREFSNKIDVHWE